MLATVDPAPMQTPEGRMLKSESSYQPNITVFDIDQSQIDREAENIWNRTGNDYDNAQSNLLATPDIGQSSEDNVVRVSGSSTTLRPSFPDLDTFHPNLRVSPPYVALFILINCFLPEFSSVFKSIVHPLFQYRVHVGLVLVMTLFFLYPLYFFSVTLFMFSVVFRVPFLSISCRFIYK